MKPSGQHPGGLGGAALGVDERDRAWPVEVLLEGVPGVLCDLFLRPHPGLDRSAGPAADPPPPAPVCRPDSFSLSRRSRKSVAVMNRRGSSGGAAGGGMWGGGAVGGGDRYAGNLDRVVGPDRLRPRRPGGRLRVGGRQWCGRRAGRRWRGREPGDRVGERVALDPHADVGPRLIELLAREPLEVLGGEQPVAGVAVHWILGHVVPPRTVRVALLGADPMSGCDDAQSGQVQPPQGRLDGAVQRRVRVGHRAQGRDRHLGVHGESPASTGSRRRRGRPRWHRPGSPLAVGHHLDQTVLLDIQPRDPRPSSSPVRTSIPCSLACASERPTDATSGWVKVTLGTAR